MTNKQKELVQSSFALVAPIAETAAQLFYNRLFEIDPSLRRLFKGNVEEQGRKLMQMLALAVKGLDHPESLLPGLRALGARHEQYGVQARDYATVGAALLWTLECGLGAAFTSEVEEAWLAVYTMIAETMQSRAAKAAA